MKETILDVLMYMFQSYVEDNEEVELDKESLHKNLSEAGFADRNIEKAFEWLEGLPGIDDNTLLNKPTKNSFRLFSDAEHSKIGEEGLSFLMFLDLGQIRWVVLMILFNTPGNESNYTWLQNLNSDKILPYIH